VAGILLALGVVSAYTHKLKTGEGQMVDTSLFEAGITLTYWQSAIAFATGLAPQALGSAHPLNAPYQAVRTKDGYINLGAANQRVWARAMEVIGRSDLAVDPRFRENAGRMENRAELITELEQVFTTASSAEWLDLFDREGVPAGPILDINAMHNDPQVIARDMVPWLHHPVAGDMQTIGLPIKMNETPGQVATPAPVFGQHTREVLNEYGYDNQEIAALAAAGAIHLGDITDTEVAS
jgi:crotonobetainyl-CoA:carnitine CoA-transferase CaiB-like acyl-CoA transferase